MPRSTDSFALLDAGNSLADGDDVSDHLVAGDPGPGVAQEALPEELISVADTTGQCLDEDLARAGQLEVDVLQNQLGSLVVKDSGSIGLGKRWSHLGYWEWRVDLMDVV